MSKLEETSNTSISSITSGSFTSCAAINFAASATASGVSRITNELDFSLINTSLALIMVLSSTCICLASALVSWKVRIIKSWCSFNFDGVAGYMYSVLSFMIFFSNWFCNKIRLMVSSTVACLTKTVAFKSAFKSLSIKIFSPVVLEIASKIILRLASLNCSEIGFL